MSLALISTHTASASSSIAITSGITSTYDSYEFHFVNMHPATQHVHWQFQVNASGQSGFNETITSSHVVSYHNEGGTDYAVAYSGSYDQAQGTAYQSMFYNLDYENDESCSGVLTLYAPSSTTYVKQFTSRVQGNHHSANYSMESYVAGYINTTGAIDEISFKFHSGNIDAGTIKMLGVS